jgi:hypothetical protein
MTSFSAIGLYSDRVDGVRRGFAGDYEYIDLCGLEAGSGPIRVRPTSFIQADGGKP